LLGDADDVQQADRAPIAADVESVTDGQAVSLAGSQGRRAGAAPAGKP
jgi:hypothetical protein